MDEKVKFVTQTGDKINMLWPGRRYALPFKNVIIDKFAQKTGMPHHSLLPNLSVFLRPDDMAVYNELQQLTMDWKTWMSPQSSTMKSMDTIMGKAMWGFGTSAMTSKLARLIQPRWMTLSTTRHS